ncbi:MAG: GyrI-like domain-containing protein [Chthonomonadales bacterium]|nr:GyrI-like domain-containing protein [Chthonomonadales bacterium]
MLAPTLCEQRAFQVLGIQERIDPTRADYRALWGRFERRAKEVRALATEEAGYGVYFDCDESSRSDFVAGMAAARRETVPAGLVLREVPAGTWAVFECTMATIGATWEAILGQWLPASGMDAAEGKPAYERFPPGCHEGAAPVTIHLAVVRRPVG